MLDSKKKDLVDWDSCQFTVGGTSFYYDVEDSTILITEMDAGTEIYLTCEQCHLLLSVMNSLY